MELPVSAAFVGDGRWPVIHVWHQCGSTGTMSMNAMVAQECDKEVIREGEQSSYSIESRMQESRKVEQALLNFVWYPRFEINWIRPETVEMKPHRMPCRSTLPEHFSPCVQSSKTSFVIHQVSPQFDVMPCIQLGAICP
jgi:metal-sulfur cluster biosynthetic enzyme